jgi:hypothetical protein
VRYFDRYVKEVLRHGTRIYISSITDGRPGFINVTYNYYPKYRFDYVSTNINNDAFPAPKEVRK